MISLQMFKAACPSNKEPDQWVAVLNKMLPKYHIDTLRREAMFLAQTGHESLDYRVTVENLNYSKRGLLTTFPKYYTDSLANAHARKPQLIANHVYGGRMGNDRVNDGWFYRGLGVIQLTGEWNHTEFGKTIGMTPEQARDYMQSKEGMIEAACWYWETNGLNRLSDGLDVQGATKVINGGTKGIVDRKARLLRILEASEEIDVSSDTPLTVSTPLYRIGSKGEMVKAIQNALGITADGDYGVKTKNAVKAYQAKNGLTADGIVGRDTLKKLGL